MSRLRLYARAVVRRYHQKIRVWQIENELDAAVPTTLVPTGRKGRLWQSEAFALEVIRTLSEAVRAEDPGALRVTNFVTELEPVDDWKAMVGKWSPYLDWIGIDVYANYTSGEPVRAALVGQRVTEALAVSGGRPVLVMETGYPSAPLSQGFSEQHQAEYLTAAAHAAIEAGASGFFVYTLTSPESDSAFGTGLQSVENYWGFFRSSGDHKPAYEAYRAAAAELQGRR